MLMRRHSILVICAAAALAWLTWLALAGGLLPGAGAAETPGRLVVATSTPYDTLDPHVVLDTQRADARLHLYDGLFRWMEGPLRVVPWLAQSYTASEDGRTFRFTLHKGARFHDGREIKAADVVYSVERILALKRGIAPLLAGLVSPGSTKAVDASTVEFSLSRASPLFLTLLTEIYVVNAELLKANEVNNDWGRAWLQQNAAGSGAYALKSFAAGTGLLVERFAGHWNTVWSERPVAEVEFRTVLDPEARIDGLIRGEAHVVQGNLLPHQVRRLREAKDVAIIDSDSPRLFVGLLNSAREPMKSQAFRRVLAQAFDAATWTATTLGNGASPLAIPLPPAFGAAPAGLQRPPYDLAAAAASLAKLKPPPRDFVIGAIAGDPHSERAALVMLDGLTRLGLGARIVAEPWPVVAAQMRDEKLMYDILFLWQGVRYLDANNWLGEMYDCDLLGAGNSSWYCNRDIDRLLKEARQAADPRLRRQGFERAAQMLAEDQAGIFLATARRPIAHLKRVKGLKSAPAGEAIDPRLVTLD